MPPSANLFSGFLRLQCTVFVQNGSTNLVRSVAVSSPFRAAGLAPSSSPVRRFGSTVRRSAERATMDLWKTRPMICKTSKDFPSFTSRKSRVRRKTRSTVKLEEPPPWDGRRHRCGCVFLAVAPSKDERNVHDDDLLCLHGSLVSNILLVKQPSGLQMWLKTVKDCKTPFPKGSRHSVACKTQYRVPGFFWVQGLIWVCKPGVS